LLILSTGSPRVLTGPAGGYTLWIKMARTIGAATWPASASRSRPARNSFPGGGPSRYFRLCIAKSDEDEIGIGIRRLGEALAALPTGAKERS
jgi:DNA-binding transcriptional MocR family regulator